MSHGDYHRWLFRVATGWLGWRPEDAYRTHMADIEEAYMGRVDLLRSIFGGKEKPTSNLPLAEKFRAAMAMRGTLKVERKREP